MHNEHVEVIYLPSLFSLILFCVCKEEARRVGYCQEEQSTGLIAGEMCTLALSYHCTWV